MGREWGPVGSHFKPEIAHKVASFEALNVLITERLRNARGHEDGFSMQSQRVNFGVGSRDRQSRSWFGRIRRGGGGENGHEEIAGYSFMSCGDSDASRVV